MKKTLILGGAVFIAVLGGVAHYRREPVDWVLADPRPYTRPPFEDRRAATSDDREAIFEEVFSRASSTETLHAPNLVALGDDVLITWYEGSREGAKDVATMSVRLSKKNGYRQTSEVKKILDAPGLRRRLKTPEAVDVLGNASLARLSDCEGSGGARPVVFAGFRSVGGWSFMKIALTHPYGDSAVVLPTAAFFGRTAAVRSTPIYYSDGSVGLPIYHEMFKNYSELLRVDGCGRVISKRRITNGDHEIQPHPIPLDAQRVGAVFRNIDYDDGESPGILYSVSDDAGQTWRAPKKTGLFSPNSPSAGIKLSDGSIALIYNDTRRDRLSIALSDDDGATWKRARVLEKGGAGDVRYPNVIRLSDDEYLSVYSFGSKHGVKAVRFNERWLTDR